ncbi:hypothetical protein [Candidatus Nitronereus thalassa]|uniref:Uncharacterized protein n=1 Tax=Candidatus Nitronereus thalassa TaxID=3020898 RepID=A0ABU3K7V6_9BACT|nr:hypothetical protein [Candidatus Nitronereus thalassa]MDT7042444.1 hypothetical protein [Candidatus Nitronereus thalassa]
MFACARPLRPCSEQALRGPSASVPNQDGSGTRSEVQGHLSAQTAFARKPIRDSTSAALNAGTTN